MPNQSKNLAKYYEEDKETDRALKELLVQQERLNRTHQVITSSNCELAQEVNGGDTGCAWPSRWYVRSGLRAEQGLRLEAGSQEPPVAQINVLCRLCFGLNSDFIIKFQHDK